jgi:hypothetical protein
MPNTKTLTNRLKEVLTKGKWVTGTNFKSEIVDLDWTTATKSVHGLNTVALLTFHIHYYIKGVSDVLKGKPLTIRDKFSFDAPEIKSQQDWQDLVDLFCKDAEEFITLVDMLSDQDLKAPFDKPEYGDIQRNIDLMIEHCYYHLGQVVLIKKILLD